MVVTNWNLVENAHISLYLKIEEMMASEQEILVRLKSSMLFGLPRGLPKSS